MRYSSQPTPSCRRIIIGCRWARAPVAVPVFTRSRREFDDCRCRRRGPDEANQPGNIPASPKQPRSCGADLHILHGFTVNRRNYERWKKNLLNCSTSFLPFRFSSLRSRVRARPSKCTNAERESRTGDHSTAHAHRVRQLSEPPPTAGSLELSRAREQKLDDTTCL